MKNILFGIVFISPPFLKKLILKWFCGGRFGRGSSIGWFSSVVGARVELGEFTVVKPFTLIRCDGEVRIGNYTEVSSFSLIYGCANFRVGNKCYIGPQTWINVSEDVAMGNRVGIGPRTMIFTHGSFLPYTEGYWARFGKVTIKNNACVASDVFLNPGVEIGEDVYVTSRSTIKESIPSGWVVEGFPAKEVCRLNALRRPITPDRRDALILNILKHFLRFLQQTNRRIRVEYSENRVTVLRPRKRNYLIILVDSKGEVLHDYKRERDERIIALVNCQNWALSISKNRMLIFDFMTMKTPYSRDKVHRELYQFMKMYYGVIFEFEQC